jgi:outer membrane lipoprotein LolB
VRSFVAGGLLMLAGCAALEPAPMSTASLASVPREFEMAGRLSVRVADRSDIAKLRWTHRASSDAWVVSSPIGTEVARIESDAGGAVLRRASGGDERAPDFATLTERLLGAPLEPAMLSGWLHGARPAGAAAAGWTVTLDETQRAGAVELARRITATRGDTVVKLVVDSYRALGD